MTYQIADISSETEVEKLFRMILKRYEKYYEVSFEAYTDDILQMIYDDPLIREKTNYRGYTQAIMRVLDQFRNKPPKAKRVKKGTKLVIMRTVKLMKENYIISRKRSMINGKKQHLFLKRPCYVRCLKR